MKHNNESATKVIFVNRYFYPDHSATSQLLTDLAFHLVRQGIDVNIITSRQKYDDPSVVLAESEQVQGVLIHRIWTTHFGRQNLFGRAFDYLSFYGSAFIHLLRSLRRGDILVAKTDPPMISIVAAICAWIRGATLVNWTQDLFPEVARALGVRALNIIYPLVLRIRNYSLKRAARNIVIGEKMAARLRQEGVPSSNISVIHNWSIDDDIRPVNHADNPFRKNWALENKFVVGYSGNIGRAHEFDTLLAAAKALRDNERIRFLVIGGGAQYEKVKQKAIEQKLQNVVFQPYQAREDLQYSLTVADLHVISLRPELEGLIVPSKFYGIAASGRPVLYIGSPEGEIAEIITTNQCGEAIEIGQAAAVVEFINKLADDPGLSQKMGQRARQLFESHYSKQHAFKAWWSILDELGAKRIIR